MNTSIVILSAILFVLMAVIGGKRGVRSFFSMIYIIITFITLLMLISWGFEPVLTTLAVSMLISSILLFNINGVNAKTKISNWAVIITVILTLLITYPIVSAAKIQGFSFEQFEQISFTTPYIDIDLTKLVFLEILIGLLGAIVDVAISISTALHELKIHEPSLTFRQLFKSGMNIGGDILGTMTHTLLFAYLGGFFSILIWFSTLNYSLTETLNSKLFTSEIFHILSGGIGIILVIPIISALKARSSTKLK